MRRARARALALARGGARVAERAGAARGVAESLAHGDRCSRSARASSWSAWTTTRRASPRRRGCRRVGGLYDPSLEAVVALAPDLVVLVPSAEQRGFRERLEALGVRCLALDSGELRRRARRDRDARRARSAASGGGARAWPRSAARAAPRREPRARALPVLRGVLVLQRDPLFVAGGGTFVDEMLRALRRREPRAAQPGPWPRARARVAARRRRPS